MEKKELLIGFDFSVNKPAMTALFNDKFRFFIWPLNLTKKENEIWPTVTDVETINRNLNPIDKKQYDSSELVFIHTVRSFKLAYMIADKVDELIDEYSADSLSVSSEGLSFGSHGDEVTNLATYKGVMLSELYRRNMGLINGKQKILDRICTYSPVQIKKIAGCSSKEKRGLKNAMIDAFTLEPIESDFKNRIMNGSLKAKTNFIHCVDDIVDSYWALKTMCLKCGLKGYSRW